MDSIALPVANGVLPRPDGGEIKGIFLDPLATRTVQAVGNHGDLFLCPFTASHGLYPVGVMVTLEESWLQSVFLGYRGGPQRKVVALLARVVGRGRFRAGTFWRRDRLLVAGKLQAIDVDALRSQGYPVVDGAGWQPVGGHTETAGLGDVRVTVQGMEYEKGRSVGISAELGGILSPEAAHTVEHGLIRALTEVAFCSPRVLSQAMIAEGHELEMSLEVGFGLRRPDVFGVTQTGACGNPLSDLAHFYLAQELVAKLKEGQSFAGSLEEACNLTLSRLVDDLELTDQVRFRVPQALKHGMFHDDTPLDQKTVKRILARFPASPWGQ